ncbi:hypothetical protein [Pseudoxanthomonas sp.]|uniref:hypothetical protein n=1 Tax=Pseudoxanthomonas sp. TaxID=1871049 RepID=UPI0026333DAF|nr:hypothetical protein [Pseudoxanthomonas sp.]WDS36379.1 MAG: hypothetical protein O8I58_00075 [Pseudoxanthomonas sp.]
MKIHGVAALGMALVGAQFAAKAYADEPVQQEEASSQRPGITEISDEELDGMRGRYTVDDGSVAWFGVTMNSSWQSDTGQVLQSALKIGMDFSDGKQRPVVTFEPVVSITASDAPTVLADTAPSVRHVVNGAGLANANGMVQSVQVAGDDNSAANVTSLRVLEGGSIPLVDAGAGVLGHGASATVAAHRNGALAQAGIDGGAARVLLQIEGAGAVQQWVGNGSMGQTIQLGGYHQNISNSMELTLIRQSASAGGALMQNVAQAIGFSRGVTPSNF